jgi:hypothetical protein
VIKSKGSECRNQVYGMWSFKLVASTPHGRSRVPSSFPRTPVVRQMTPTLARGLSEYMAGLTKSCDRHAWRKGLWHAFHMQEDTARLPTECQTKKLPSLWFIDKVQSNMAAMQAHATVVVDIPVDQQRKARTGSHRKCLYNYMR